MPSKRIKNKKFHRVLSEKDRLDLLFASHQQGVKIDLGCGENKQPGWIGVDFRAMKNVDIVQNLAKYPWDKLPDECASTVMTSHLLEHINPDSPDPRLASLIDLLVSKKVLTKEEVSKQIGDYMYLGGFIRFMDEVWRIMKPGGQFHNVFPYAGSYGYWQDPTHVNGLNDVTFAYFDPLAKDPHGNNYNLYSIYRPKPWKILKCFYNPIGFVEISLEKRIIDKSYRVTNDNGLKS